MVYMMTNLNSFTILYYSTNITFTDKTPKEGWPEHGVITFNDVSLQYNTDDHPVLKNLNFCIKEKEKVSNTYI